MTTIKYTQFSSSEEFERWQMQKVLEVSELMVLSVNPIVQSLHTEVTSVGTDEEVSTARPFTGVFVTYREKLKVKINTGKRIIDFSEDGNYLIFRRSEYIYKDGARSRSAENELGGSDGDIPIELPLHMRESTETLPRSDRYGIAAIIEWVNAQLN